MENNKKSEDVFSDLFKQAVDSSADTPEFFRDMAVPEFRMPDKAEQDKPLRKRGKHSLTLKIASLTLAFLITSSVMAVFMSDNSVSEAARNRMTEIRWSSDDDVQVISEDMGNGETRETMVMYIDDSGDLDKAKKFLPELYLPSYMPEGYEFASLEISRSDELCYTASQAYMNEEQKYITISQNYYSEKNDGKLIIRDAEYVLNFSKGELYVTYYEDSELLSGFYILNTDRVDISLCGKNFDELISIADGLCISK